MSDVLMVSVKQTTKKSNISKLLIETSLHLHCFIAILLSQQMYPKGLFNPLWKIGLISLRILRNSGGKKVSEWETCWCNAAHS